MEWTLELIIQCWSSISYVPLSFCQASHQRIKTKLLDLHGCLFDAGYLSAGWLLRGYLICYVNVWKTRKTSILLHTQSSLPNLCRLLSTLINISFTLQDFNRPDRQPEAFRFYLADWFNTTERHGRYLEDETIMALDRCCDPWWSMWVWIFQ